MPDHEKVVLGLEHCSEDGCKGCPYEPDCKMCDGFSILAKDALELINYQDQHIEAFLRDQEPRVLTLEEVIDHYSLPPVFVDDLNAQEDYMQDITPLYFDFPSDDSWAVHWRGYQSIRKYLDDWKASYGKNWRCWTAKPTEEQRKAVKWNDI